MTALIVDDEKRARKTISEIIKLYTPELDQIIEAESVETAIYSIRKHKPQIIFLDIRLEDGNGFDIFSKIKAENLNVIFITAYDEYALKALKVSAIDYLMKPIDPDEFIIAVDKALKKINAQKMEERIGLFMQNIKTQNLPTEKITLKTADSIHILKVNDILYCQADRNYTSFFLTNDKTILVSKNLREYEELLPSDTFIRPHQSYLINTNHITKYDKTNQDLHLSNNHIIPISSRKKELLLNFLKKL